MAVNVTDTHTHDFNQVQLKRIMEVQQKYSGHAGDKAFLLRKCDCGQTQAFDYGAYPQMLANAKELKRVKAESVV